MNSGDLVDRGTVLSVIAKVVAGKVAIIEGEELVDGKFIMPASGVKLSVEYEDVLGFDSATYDRVTKSLTVSGSSLTGIIHIGIFSGQTKLLEAFTVTKSGKFTQDVLLDGIVPGDYIVKVWDSSAACVLEKEFKLVPSAYKVTVKYSGYSSIIEDKVIEVECGKEYSVESPVMEGYTADKLVISGTMGESDVIFEVVYSVNRYTVVFMNGETELQRTEVAYGEKPAYNGTAPAKEADAQYNYTFRGWNSEIVAVTGDATYVAEFDSAVNRYTVVFMNGETVFDTQVLDYGQIVSAPVQVPEVPAGKVFVRWDGLTSETVVTGDMAFDAIIENGKIEENGNVSYEKTEDDGSSTTGIVDKDTGASTETNVKIEGKTETTTETKKDSDGNTTSVVVDAVINSTVITKQDIESVIENIQKAETENPDVKVDKTITIQSTDSVASVTAESIKAIADAGATLEMAVGESTEVVLAPEVLQKITGASTEKVSVSVEPVKKAMLNVKQQKVVGDSPVFELSASVGSKALHDEMKGTVVTVPYVLEGGNAADLCVWFMDDDGNIEKAKDVTYNAEDKTVTFTVEHFSKYVVGFDLVPYEKGEDNTVMVLAVIAAIVVVFVAAMLLFIRRIEKQAL
ncbi:MAG: hypothetical protein MJZ68_02765 [archaeon]|nr:hypothetical protein [archaeon]